MLSTARKNLKTVPCFGVVGGVEKGSGSKRAGKPGGRGIRRGMSKKKKTEVQARVDAAPVGNANTETDPAHASPVPPGLQKPKHPTLIQLPSRYSLSHAARLSPTAFLPPVVWNAEQTSVQVPLPIFVTGPFGHAVPEVLVQSVPGHDVLVMWGLSPGMLSDEGQPTARWMLGVSDDLSLFRAMCEKDPAWAERTRTHAGYVWRSPAVFEDLVKVLLLCKAGRKKAASLCQSLCDAFGQPTMLHRTAFPTAELVAKASETLLREELGFGKLAKTVLALADVCAQGQPEPETLKRPSLPIVQALLRENALVIDDLLKEEFDWQDRVRDLLCTLPGFGVKEVPMMMPLLGLFDLPPVDADSLRAWAKRYPPSRKNPEPETYPQIQRRMHQHLGRFAPYVGLAQSILMLPDLSDTPADKA